MRVATLLLLAGAVVAALLESATLPAHSPRRVAPAVESPVWQRPTEVSLSVETTVCSAADVEPAPLLFRNDAGGGVAGVRVRARYARHTSSAYPRQLGVQTTVSDDGGSAPLEAPSDAGWYDLSCTPPPEFVPPAPRRVRRRYGQWPRTRIRLADARQVEGIVVREDETPVPGCLVRAKFCGSEEFICEAVTDRTGAYRIPVPYRLDEVTLDVDAINGGSGDHSLADRRLPNVWSVQSLRIVLPRAVSLELRFPGLGLNTGALCIDRNSRRHRGRGFTFRSHTLHLSRLAPGHHEFIYVRQPGLPLAPAVARVFLPHDGPVTMRCEPGATVRGVVLGQDVDGFQADFQGCTALVSDGRFLIDHAVNEPADLYLHRTGDPRCAYIRDVQPSEQSQTVDLELGYEIHGIVRDFDPHRHTGVQAIRGDIRVEGVLEADGVFRIIGLPQLPFRVELMNDSSIVTAIEPIPAGARGVLFHPR